jgi:hypothetical protein
MDASTLDGHWQRCSMRQQRWWRRSPAQAGLQARFTGATIRVWRYFTEKRLTSGSGQEGIAMLSNLECIAAATFSS